MVESVASEERTMRVLFVCTGNICRSAAADRLLTAWTDGGSVEVRSAGTRATQSRPMHPYTEAALADHRVETRGFASRRLTEQDLDWSDLVLTMTAQHREEVVALSPRALRKTFTLLEAAALSEVLPSDRLESAASAADPPAAFVEMLVEARALARQRARPVDEGVPDPIQESAEFHAEVVGTIAAALSPLADVLPRPRLSDATVRMPRLPPVPPRV
jgi:protein-tyrosine-phosphatase